MADSMLSMAAGGFGRRRPGRRLFRPTLSMAAGGPAAGGQADRLVGLAAGRFGQIRPWTPAAVDAGGHGQHRVGRACECHRAGAGVRRVGGFWGGSEMVDSGKMSAPRFSFGFLYFRISVISVILRFFCNFCIFCNFCNFGNSEIFL